MSKAVLMCDIKGTELSVEEGLQLRNPYIAGLVLFSRNYKDAKQLTALIRSIRTIRPDLILAIDQEGGRVQRLRGEPFTRIPPMEHLGNAYKNNKNNAVALAKECGWLIACEMKAFDIDISFIPVLDLNMNLSTVIGDRAFGSNKEQVCDLAGALVAGMHEVGMTATGKHFPGHGGVKADSHIALPTDKRHLEELDEELAVYKTMFQKGMGAVMPAHIIFSQIDTKPIGFSSHWLQKILREKLQFKGVIISDCLSMVAAGITGSFPKRAEEALKAGCDIILVCNNPKGAKEVLDHLSKDSFDITTNNTASLRSNHSIELTELLASKRHKTCRNQLEQLEGTLA